jgi:hypothetical protein
MKSSCLVEYHGQLDHLREVIETVFKRVADENPDTFLLKNTNFFSKSFYVMMCAYLESYIKDALMQIVEEADSRLLDSKLPHNLIKWNFNSEAKLKETEFRYGHLKMTITKKDLDNHTSGNPFRTRDLFKYFGINLDEDETFGKQREKINTIIVKRNKILHHNDDASDVSNVDLVDNIELIKSYTENLDRIISNSLSR